MKTSDLNWAKRMAELEKSCEDCTVISPDFHRLIESVPPYWVFVAGSNFPVHPPTEPYVNFDEALRHSLRLSAANYKAEIRDSRDVVIRTVEPAEEEEWKSYLQKINAQ